MITLNLSANEQYIIKQASQKLGVSVEEFFRLSTIEKAQAVTHSKKVLLNDLLNDLPAAQFTADGVQVQREMRAEWES